MKYSSNEIQNNITPYTTTAQLRQSFRIYSITLCLKNLRPHLPKFHEFQLSSLVHVYDIYMHMYIWEETIFFSFFILCIKALFLLQLDSSRRRDVVKKIHIKQFAFGASLHDFARYPFRVE